MLADVGDQTKIKRSPTCINMLQRLQETSELDSKSWGWGRNTSWCHVQRHPRDSVLDVLEGRQYRFGPGCIIKRNAAAGFRRGLKSNPPTSKCRLIRNLWTYIYICIHTYVHVYIQSYNDFIHTDARVYIYNIYIWCTYMIIHVHSPYIYVDIYI